MTAMQPVADVGDVRSIGEEVTGERRLLDHLLLEFRAASLGRVIKLARLPPGATTTADGSPG